MNSLAAAPITEEGSWFFTAIGEVRIFVSRLFQKFLRFFAAGILFTIVLALVIGYSGGSGVLWKASLGAVVAFFGGVFLSFVVATKLAVVTAAGETVKQNQLGQRVLDALFSQLLGVTMENPNGTSEMIRALHGMPVAQLELRFSEAARAMLANSVLDPALPRPGRWLANKVQQLIVRAAMRVIVAYCTAGKSGDETIDLPALRSNLAREMDNLVAEKIQRGAFSFMMWMALLGTFLGWLLVEALRRVPGG